MEKERLMPIIEKPFTFTKYKDVEFSNIQEQINQAMVDCHEKVLKDVLRQLLNREPVLEDAKRLTRYTYQGVFDSYDLAFDGIKVGKVVYGGFKNYSVVFEPVEELKTCN